MPRKTDPYEALEKQVDAQIKMLEEVVSDPNPESKSERLDTCTRALLTILRSLKSLRELSAAAADPTALLREALQELEEEWTELHACKEMLRSGGAVPAAEVSDAAQA
jgi:hypothetical protein